MKYLVSIGVIFLFATYLYFYNSFSDVLVFLGIIVGVAIIALSVVIIKSCSFYIKLAFLAKRCKRNYEKKMQKQEYETIKSRNNQILKAIDSHAFKKIIKKIDYINSLDDPCNNLFYTFDKDEVDNLTVNIFVNHFLHMGFMCEKIFHENSERYSIEIKW